MLTRGKFIVFEGLDGSGKTTQLELLQRRLAAVMKKRKCYMTREPSDSVVGLITRGAVKGKILLEPETMAMLFAADRFEHITKDIIPQLEKGNHVLCDRYYFSNFAYQSSIMDIEKLLNYNDIAMNRLRPDVTIFLDVLPKECAERLSYERAGTELYEDIENLEIVRNNYLKAFELLQEKENIMQIESIGNADKTFELIWLQLVKGILSGEDAFV